MIEKDDVEDKDDDSDEDKDDKPKGEIGID